MSSNPLLTEKYNTIIQVLCKSKGIQREELFKILKDKECKYILFLLLKKYKCINFEKLNRDFLIESRKSINYNFKKAEEKFFINKEFRESYFEIESLIEKSM